MGYLNNETLIEFHAHIGHCKDYSNAFREGISGTSEQKDTLEAAIYLLMEMLALFLEIKCTMGVCMII